MTVKWTSKTITMEYGASDYLGADNGPRMGYETYRWAGHDKLRDRWLECVSRRRKALETPDEDRDEIWVSDYEQIMSWRANILDTIRETLPVWRKYWINA